MTAKYISLLRGINVGGHKKIKMADLKIMYESLGLGGVVTYIQSGNVIFEAAGQGAAEVQLRIKTAIADTFGFEVPVVVRTPEQFITVIENCPFGRIDLAVEGTMVAVAFLDGTPPDNLVAGIQPFVTAPEELVIIGCEVYLRCPNGYGKTKLTNTFLERKLGQAATTRNWKTVCKLAELSA